MKCFDEGIAEIYIRSCIPLSLEREVRIDRSSWPPIFLASHIFKTYIILITQAEVIGYSFPPEVRQLRPFARKGRMSKVRHHI